MATENCLEKPGFFGARWLETGFLPEFGMGTENCLEKPGFFGATVLVVTLFQLQANFGVYFQGDGVKIRQNHTH